METVEELRLAHFSVKEYLRSPGIASSPVQESAIRDVQAHSFIAESCLAYISHVISNPPLADEWLHKHPLTRYALVTGLIITLRSENKTF